MAALLPAVGFAQAPPEYTFRAQSNLALISFHVVKDGSSVGDLRPDEIEIREEGAPVRVAVFEGGRYHARTIPLELMLLFDTSGSIRNSGLLNPRVFDKDLLALHPQVTISVSGFTHEWTAYAAPTRDLDALNRAAAAVMDSPPGGTRLYEAVIRTVREAASRGGLVTRALVIFSDSVAPRDAEAEAIRSARDAGIAVYPVILGGPPSPESPRRYRIPWRPQSPISCGWARPPAAGSSAAAGHRFWAACWNGSSRNWKASTLPDAIRNWRARAGRRTSKWSCADARRGRITGGTRVIASAVP